MRWIISMLCVFTTGSVLFAQEPPAAKATPTEIDAQRAAWGLSEEQYLLADRSRRPGGDTYSYWQARGRGPYGNLLERIPGGPRRPVKI